jgi:O-antigen/teichoic acid export membrane protein
MNTGKFIQKTLITLIGSYLNLLLGIGTSIVLSRALGPEGRGIYAMVTLLPSLIITFGNLGIGSATAYYVARGEFRRQEILGNNILLSVGIGGIAVLAGLVVVLFFRETIFPGVSFSYLLLALAYIPINFFSLYISCILLGAQYIKELNYIQIAQSGLLLWFFVLALLWLNAGVTGAILAELFTRFISSFMAFYLTLRITEGIDFKPNIFYMRQVTKYGIQTYFMNILGFLNYRIDMFLINRFLGPTAVGLYSVGVGLVEKLWIVSFAASTVLFPWVAAETEEQKRKEFTPLVARTVLWMTALASLILAFLSKWIVLLLYSEAFLPAADTLRALLIGITTLSAGRVLSNDIAGRGFPGLNIYTGLAAVTTNVVLNLLWIPRYGIVGAAWASTVSYTVSFLGALFFYCRLSGNQWTKVVLPQSGDWALYFRAGKFLCRWIGLNLRGVLLL